MCLQSSFSFKKKWQSHECTEPSKTYETKQKFRTITWKSKHCCLFYSKTCENLADFDDKRIECFFRFLLITVKNIFLCCEEYSYLELCFAIMFFQKKASGSSLSQQIQASFRDICNAGQQLVWTGASPFTHFQQTSKINFVAF